MAHRKKNHKKHRLYPQSIKTIINKKKKYGTLAPWNWCKADEYLANWINITKQEGLKIIKLLPNMLSCRKNRQKGMISFRLFSQSNNLEEWRIHIKSNKYKYISGKEIGRKFIMHICKQLYTQIDASLHSSRLWTFTSSVRAIYNKECLALFGVNDQRRSLFL